ncbi:MFS transporter [Nonomuraea sp. NPDC050328]|uniref:MFS transporter n=1 Tax=Nonomuraea sp. NPDC050328 TaxID=3364361 RepID=UPI0037B46F8B
MLDTRTTPSAGLRLLGLSTGFFMVLLDSSILNVALPDISASLGGTLTGQQWTVSAYVIAFGALLLSSGALADRFGAGRVFRLGLIAFAAASLLCALAPSLPLLVLFRAFQGAAAAAIPASTLSLLGALYPAPAARARAVGTWAVLTGLGFAAGPLVGGLLVDLGGWRTIFLVNLPLALLGLALTATFRNAATPSPTFPAAASSVPPLGPAERPAAPSLPTTPLDWRSQTAAVVTLGLLTAAVLERSALLGLLTLLALPILLLTERRSPAPAFPPRLLQIRRLRRVTLLGTAQQFVMASVLFTLGLYFLQARHLTPGQTGLALLPYTIGPATIGPLVGRLVAARGPELPTRLGLTLGATGTALTALAILTGAPLALLMTGLLIAGLGTPLTLVPLTAMTVAAAPPGTGGVAGGLFNAFRQVGAALGVAGLGGLVALFDPVEGTATALALGAAVLAGAAVLRP